MSSRKNRLLFCIILLISIGQFVVDLYMPSLPYIVQDLHSSSFLVKMTVSVYLLGFGISQLIYGPISDNRGRRGVLMFGVILCLIGLGAAFFARSVWQLILCRALQGIGAGAPTVIGRVSLRDVYKGKDLAKASAITAVFILAIPMIAPMFGGYIETYLGWRFAFLILALYTLVAFLVLLFAHEETLDKEHVEKMGLVGALKMYGRMCRNRTFLSFSFMSSCCYGFFISYATASSFLFQEGLQASPTEFGWYLLLVASSLGIGSMVCSHLVKRMRLLSLFSLGTFLLSLGAIAFFLLAMRNVFSVWMMIVPVYIGGLGAGINFPNCTTGALTGYKKGAGKAGALIGATQMVMGFIFTWILSKLHTRSPIPLATLLLGITVANFLVYFVFVRPHFVEEED